MRYPAQARVLKIFTQRFFSVISTYVKGCRFKADGASLAALTNFFRIDREIGFYWNRRILLLLRIAWYTSIVFHQINECKRCFFKISQGTLTFFFYEIVRCHEKRDEYAPLHEPQQNPRRKTL